MHVSVIYRAQYRAAVGQEEETIPLNIVAEGTLAGLLRQLVQLHPVLEPMLFDSGGNRRPSAMVFVNDQLAPHDMQLCDGMQVTLLSPMSGG